MTRRWREGSTICRTHALVAEASPDGLVRRQIKLSLGEGSTETQLDAALMILKRDGHITQIGGRCGVYAVDHNCTPLPVKGAELHHALAILAEYPGGISEQLLAQELATPVRALRQVLATAQKRGLVHGIFMPPAHGGGPGWMAADAAAPAPAPAPAPGIGGVRQPPLPPPLRIPAFMAPDEPSDFNCIFTGAERRLAITSGHVRLELPAHHTQALVAFLRAANLQQGQLLCA